MIVGIFIFATVLFLGLTVVAVLTLRRARPARSAHRIPLCPWPPILFLALVALLLALLAAGRPKESFLGLAIVACGLPVYALVFQNPRRESP